MDLGIKGKVAVVTAASKGLGLAVATTLAGEGVNLVICSRNKERIAFTAQHIQKTFPVKVVATVCDVTNPSDIENLKDKVSKTFGTCHILFTSAAGPPSGKIMDFTSRDLQKALDLNLMSTVNLVYAFLPYMKNENWGRILALTSSNIRYLLPQFPLSNVSRNSIVPFIKTLAFEIAHLNITANILAPGLFLTDPTRAYIKEKAKESFLSYNEMLIKISDAIPTKTIGQAKDFGALAAYLSSVHSSYITGETFLIDGGANCNVM